MLLYIIYTIYFKYDTQVCVLGVSIGTLHHCPGPKLLHSGHPNS